MRHTTAAQLCVRLINSDKRALCANPEHRIIHNPGYMHFRTVLILFCNGFFSQTTSTRYVNPRFIWLTYLRTIQGKCCPIVSCLNRPSQVEALFHCQWTWWLVFKQHNTNQKAHAKWSWFQTNFAVNLWLTLWFLGSSHRLWNYCGIVEDKGAHAELIIDLNVHLYFFTHWNKN